MDYSYDSLGYLDVHEPRCLNLFPNNAIFTSQLVQLSCCSEQMALPSSSFIYKPSSLTLSHTKLAVDSTRSWSSLTPTWWHRMVKGQRHGIRSAGTERMCSPNKIRLMTLQKCKCLHFMCFFGEDFGLLMVENCNVFLPHCQIVALNMWEDIRSA